MKITALSVVSLAALVLGTQFPRERESTQVVISSAEEPQYLIEFGTGDTQWVTEYEKWQIRKVTLI
jgi:hypothetical protein